MTKITLRAIYSVQRLLSFVVIFLEIIAFDSVATCHLVDDKLRIALHEEFVATDVVSDHVVKTIDQAFVLSLVVGDTIPQIIAISGDRLWKQ
jgi:hypothetical protein